MLPLIVPDLFSSVPREGCILLVWPFLCNFILISALEGKNTNIVFWGKVIVDWLLVIFFTIVFGRDIYLIHSFSLIYCLFWLLFLISFLKEQEARQIHNYQDFPFPFLPSPKHNPHLPEPYQTNPHIYQQSMKAPYPKASSAPGALPTTPNTLSLPVGQYDDLRPFLVKQRNKDYNSYKEQVCALLVFGIRSFRTGCWDIHIFFWRMQDLFPIIYTVALVLGIWLRFLKSTNALTFIVLKDYTL